MVENSLVFKGVVQGVGFRITARRVAEGLGLKGTAQNLRDGSVEVYLQGEKDQIANFIGSMKNHFGNKIVEVVLVNEEASTGRFNSFQII